MDRAPDLALTVVPTNEHFHELHCIEAIRLGSSAAAVDFDAGGVHHLVLDSLVQQEAMQPEAVAPGLVATDHRSILGQAESLLGGLDLKEQAQGAAGGDRLDPGLLAEADAEGQLPRTGAQIQSQVEHRGGRDGTIGVVSRCHGLSSVGKSIETHQRELTFSDSRFELRPFYEEPWLVNPRHRRFCNGLFPPFSRPILTLTGPVGSGCQTCVLASFPVFCLLSSQGHLVLVSLRTCCQ